MVKHRRETKSVFEPNHAYAWGVVELITRKKASPLQKILMVAR